MSQPERRPGGPRPPERGTPPPESELPRYHQGARFGGEVLAEATYFAAQEIVFAHAGDVDLSAYRFQLSRVDHVVILGEPPPSDLHDQTRRDQKLRVITEWDRSVTTLLLPAEY